MILLRRLSIVFLALVSVGCSSGSRGDAPGLVLLVPGVGGDGSWYRNVVPALRAAGDRRTVESFAWGVPGPGFFLNFNNVSVHDRAERALADRITAERRAHPDEPIDILAHSAGGGVTLGALAKAPADVHVRRVVLLHPSVSPAYPLDASLARIDERLDLFHSDRDTSFLDWRTSHFGTYDNVKTVAAGNRGFDLSALRDPDRVKVHMHAYDPQADAALGDDGGHFGALARPFLAAKVAPLLAIIAAPASVPTQSAAASRP